MESRSTMADRRRAAVERLAILKPSRTWPLAMGRPALIGVIGRQSAGAGNCRGPSGFDVRHLSVISGVWEIPWGPGRRWMNDAGVLGAVVGGWQLSGIGTMTTGRPFTVFMQNGVNNGATSWPDRIGSGELDHPTVDLWYNPADFKAPAANTYG